MKALPELKVALCPKGGTLPPGPNSTRRKPWPSVKRVPGQAGAFGDLGAPGGIRTPDLQLRRLPLYPSELQARAFSLLQLGNSEKAQPECLVASLSGAVEGSLVRVDFEAAVLYYRGPTG
jgi:hypothetical protein